MPGVFFVADWPMVMQRYLKTADEKISKASNEEVVQFRVGALGDSRAIREMV
jgi:hypothetical protein